MFALEDCTPELRLLSHHLRKIDGLFPMIVLFHDDMWMLWHCFERLLVLGHPCGVIYVGYLQKGGLWLIAC